MREIVGIKAGMRKREERGSTSKEVPNMLSLTKDIDERDGEDGEDSEDEDEETGAGRSGVEWVVSGS